MKVLVDTSVWSLALRRKDGRMGREAATLEQLIQEGESIFLVGVILQEVLQGVRDKADFQRLSQALSGFPLLPLKRAHFVFAAEISNECRSKGVQAGTIDFLIAAASISHDCYLLTTDRDFLHISKCVNLKLLS